MSKMSLKTPSPWWRIKHDDHYKASQGFLMLVYTNLLDLHREMERLQVCKELLADEYRIYKEHKFGYDAKRCFVYPHYLAQKQIVAELTAQRKIYKRALRFLQRDELFDDMQLEFDFMGGKYVVHK